MKRIQRALAYILALFAVMTMFPTAFAARGPGDRDLERISSQIEYPKTEEYWADYGYGTIIGRGESVYCYGSADRKGSKYTVSTGEAVTVLANRDDMFCIVIPSAKKARWINRANVELYDDSYDGSIPAWSVYMYNNATSDPCEADLEEIGSGIEYPKKNEYWKDYVYAVVDAPKEHSVYCYGSADRNGSKYTVLHGEEVVILASRGDMDCIIIPSQGKARWIRDVNLIYD